MDKIAEIVYYIDTWRIGSFNMTAFLEFERSDMTTKTAEFSLYMTNS